MKDGPFKIEFAAGGPDGAALGGAAASAIGDATGIGGLY
jgi:hypothetical protein